MLSSQPASFTNQRCTVNQSPIETALKHHRQGDFSKAQKHYERIIRSNPKDFDALHLLGLLHHQCGRSKQAIPLIQKALSIIPDSANAYNNLGNALKACDLPEQAENAYLKALDIEPDAARFSNLGSLYKLQKRWDEALQAYRKAIEIDAYREEIHNNLGNVLQDMGRLDEACEAYQQAIRIQPDYAEAYYNLSLCYQNQHKQAETIDACLKVIQLQPDRAENWSALLLSSVFFPDLKPSEVFAWAKLFGERFEAIAKSLRHKNSANPEKRLKIGLVSGDLRNHPVGHFLSGALKHLNKQSMECFAYANQYEFDELSKSLKPYFASWSRVIGLTDEALAKKIQSDGIDILIDLSGHTPNHRLTLFAMKPAPVQVSWLGGLMTTGLSRMDFMLADPILIPENEAEFFTEKPYRLPNSFFCFEPPDLPLEVEGLPASKNQYITFASFNNLCKINDAVIACWSEILNRLPESRLMLKSAQLEQPAMRDRIAQRFAQKGIATERLIMQGHANFSDYLGCYQEVDIALDPFPYPGGATSVQGLWMGVPSLKLKGQTFLSHIGESILTTAGLEDWIAEDIEDYIAKALYWANHLDQLSDLRKKLRQQLLASPLCDQAQFAKDFEHALRDMWRQWCAEQNP